MIASGKNETRASGEWLPMKIGFVGLGAMGMPMAENLVKKQFSVAGFDVRAESVSAFAAKGGKASSSANEAALGADVLILMVVNSTQAEAILFDDDVLAAMPKDSIIVLMATCAPSSVKKIAQQVEAGGRHLVDAPVSGGIRGAQSGTLTIMAAAPQPFYERVLPILQVLGDKLYHIGEEPGQGAAVKTVNQLLCGVHIAVAAEAFALAEKAGIDGKLALEILGGSAAGSWMLNNRGPRMFETDPAVASAVDIFVKDLGIVADAGRALKAPLPIASAALQMFLAASAMGLGTRDDSQVVQAYRHIAGLQN
jgi:3-hydroxyisobutyrate dehydrogenase